MGTLRRIEKKSLPREILRPEIAFVGRSSFERRSFSAFEQLSESKFSYKAFFASKLEIDEAGNLRREYGISNEDISYLDTQNPLQTQGAIASVFDEVRQMTADYSLIVDITTFRREELLILLRELRKFTRDQIENTHFVYSVAGSMGSWLSNRVRNVRPVVGYPGEVDNFKKTHLIILAGVEHHRAMAAIEAYEPHSISLGMVPREYSVSSEIFERNLELRNWLVRHFEQVRTEFDFSATDPTNLKSKLKTVCADLVDFNVVIAPFNTKVSTLGVGAFAIEHPEIQLCYAEVDVYNTMEYSTPSNKVLFLPASDILLFDEW